VALFVTPPLLAPAENALVVLDYDRRAEAISTMSVHLKFHLAGDGEFHPCRSLATADNDCVALAYRWDQRPSVVNPSRLDTVDVLPIGTVVSARDTVERTVMIPTPRRPRHTTLYLYLVTRRPAGFDWSEATLQVEIGPPPADVRLRIAVTRGLLGLYVVGTALLAWIVWHRSRMTRPR
jgi:hypothetical protein